MNEKSDKTISAVIRETFSILNEKIGIVRLNEISPGLGNKEISLLKLVVPLRSDIVVSALIDESGLNLVQIHRVRKENFLAIIGCNGLIKEENEKFGRRESISEININDDFIKLVYNSVNDILNGKKSVGLAIRPRPLILSPLWKEGVKKEIADIDILSAANIFQYVVILGAPGSGKTTTAKAIAVAHYSCYSNNSQIKDISSLGLWGDPDNLPIYIELKSMVLDKEFPCIEDVDNLPNVEFFKAYIKKNLFNNNDVVMSYVTERLQSGKVVLILDGLDEVPIPSTQEDAVERRHNQLQSLIRSIKTVFYKIKIIVTSRPAGYSGWTLNGFEVLHIRPLSSKEAAHLAHSYFIAAGENDDKSKRLTENFVKEIERLPSKIREYPLFVCLLASLYRDKRGEFPAKRGGLLQVSLDTLLGPWTIKKHQGKSLQEILHCTPDELVNCLAQISLRALSEIGIYGNTDTPDVPIGLALEEFYHLGERINPTQLLNYIANQAGIWTSPANGKVRFVHRLFQEYLAAYAITQKDDCIGEMTKLVISNPVLWIEVSRLFSDILSNKKQNGELFLFIEQLLRKFEKSSNPADIIALVANIIIDEEFHLLNDSIKHSASIETCIKKLEDCLIKESIMLTGQQRNFVGLALNELGDPRKGVLLDENKLPCFEWIEIQGGEFLMGTGKDEEKSISEICGNNHWNIDREFPQHSVKVKSFMISKYPVTSIQFKAFVLAADGYANDGWWTDAGLNWRKHNGPPVNNLPDNCPQNCVTWYEAVAFCKWYSYKNKCKVRLPSEAEWEYAARRGNYNQFVWGNECKPIYANVNETGIGTVSPVGCFPIFANSQSDCIVYDMNGNVWEWCSSIVERTNGCKYKYPYNVNDGREEIEGGDNYLRATRGGYYGGEWMYARSCYRGRDIPSLRAERQGFRVIKEYE